MDAMPLWGWGLLGFAMVAVVLLGVLVVRATTRIRLLQLRLDTAVGDAARLPDISERATRAERRVEELLSAVTKHTAMEAEARANAEAARQAFDRLREEGAGREAALTDLRRTLESRQTDLAAAQATAGARQAEIVTIRSELAGTRDARDKAGLAADEARQQAAVSDAKAEAAVREAAALTHERDEARADLRRVQGELQAARTGQATAVSERDAARNALAETKAFLAEAKVQMKSAFTEAASQVFDEKAVVLEQRISASAELSKTSMEATLKPFAEKVVAFQDKVEQLGAEQAKDHATLVGTIGELKGLNQNMADAAGALTRALRGNAKARGDWGELILETVLKGSGLEEGTNYEAQVHTVDDETGQRKYPDVVVKLPDGRKVVVDSKLNYVAWTEAQNAETPEQGHDALIRHAAALRAHMRDLAEKNYPRVIGSDALDLTILFVPIEGALSAALGINPDLQTEAFGRKVVFATPNTLMAMLRVVERLWVRDRIQRQVTVINDEATKLLDALGSFLDEFDAIDNRLRQTTDAYAKAKSRLSESNQSVISRAKRLVDAGARPRRSKREEFLPVAGSDTPALSLDDDGSGESAGEP
ncbi:DNA recombination protein RmuC [Luteibacter jiangsuensis]